MIKQINKDIIRTVFIAIVVNNVIRIKASDETSEEGLNIYSDKARYNIDTTIIRKTDDAEEDEDIKTLLEEKYKFRNDETSTRFKITREERGEYPG